MADGFFDFLSGLIPQSVKTGFEEFNKVDQNLGRQIGSYVDSAVNPVQQGWQSTVDNFQGDVGKVEEGHLPSNAIRDIGGMIGMTGSGSGASYGAGPGLAKLRGYQTGQTVFDPQKGWQFIKEAEYPAMDPLKSLLQGNILGADFSDLLMKILQQTRVNAKGSPF